MHVLILNSNTDVRNLFLQLRESGKYYRSAMYQNRQTFLTSPQGEIDSSKYKHLSRVSQERRRRATAGGQLNVISFSTA